jgi:uncharacterized membrane protein
MPLVAVLAVAAALLDAVLPGSLVVLRAPAALALVLALPGYALTAAIFPPAQLRASERVLLSIAMSIVATIAGALALEVLGVRLTTAPWMALLAALAVVAAAAAVGRGHARSLTLPRVGLRRPELLALAGAVLLLGGAAALGLSPLGAPKGTQGATSLWILPHGGGAAEVGVISDELRTTRYSVEVTVAGQPTTRFGPITLASGASWTRVVTTGAGSPVVRAVLLRVANPSAVIANVALRAKRKYGGR